MHGDPGQKGQAPSPLLSSVSHGERIKIRSDVLVHRLSLQSRDLASVAHWGHTVIAPPVGYASYASYPPSA